jgi:DNA-binding transcriptional LysR family regulator
LDAACRNVAAGLGIAIVPREAVEAHVRSLGLRILALTDPWAERRFVIAMRSRETLSAAGRLLVDYLHERAAREAAPRRRQSS